MQSTKWFTTLLFCNSILWCNAFLSLNPPIEGQRLMVDSALAAATINDDDSARTVVLTREEGKNDKLYKKLSAMIDERTKLVEIPCIAHADGADYHRLEETLGAQAWDYVAITSPEAARVVAPAWEKVFGKESSSVPKVAAVGKATEATLKSLNIPVAFCPSKATAKTLVAELPNNNDNNETVLYPASTKAATTLQNGLTERGFSVTRLNTYDTVTATWSKEQQAIAEKATVACFASPSSLHGWLENTNGNTNILAACIGETSAEACRGASIKEAQIFFPEKPGIDGWADAVLEALKSAAPNMAHRQ